MEKVLINPIIICKYDKSEARNNLQKRGLREGIDFIEADKLFTLLDINWHNSCAGKKIAFWGVGAECEYLETHSDIVADVYIDKNKTGERKGKPIINPVSISNWSEHYIIVTSMKYYMEIKAELCDMGLKEYHDFVIYRKVLDEDKSPYHLAMKPSDMLRKTIYANKWSAPICMRPFDYTELVRGNVFCCCPAWVNVALGNMNMDSLNEIWHGYIAKIFRLSIINRSFSFCNPDECVHLKKYGKQDGNSVNCLQDYNHISTSPKTVMISIDPRCNLKCPQCRDDFYNISEAEEGLLNLELSRIHESDWLSSADMSVTGLGEAFFSPVYKELLFDTSKKRQRIYITSNGLLFTEQYMQKLMTIYEDIHVSISVDATTSETYKMIRGGNFEVLTRNLQNISKHRLKGNVKCFELTFCTQRRNVREIPAFVEMAHQLCVDKVRF